MIFGHVHILQWMKDNGMTGELLECHMYLTAGRGHLEVVKWLHVNGCPWDEKACLFAGARTVALLAAELARRRDGEGRIIQLLKPALQHNIDREK